MAGLRGLYVNIYRHDAYGDCTANGVTSPQRAPKGTALLLGIPDGNYSEDDIASCVANGIPVLVVERRQFGDEEYVTAKPHGEKRHCMAGGNFVYTSDSRFRRVCAYPISVHDRVEV